LVFNFIIFIAFNYELLLNNLRIIHFLFLFYFLLLLDYLILLKILNFMFNILINLFSISGTVFGGYLLYWLDCVINLFWILIIFSL